MTNHVISKTPEAFCFEHQIALNKFAFGTFSYRFNLSDYWRGESWNFIESFVEVRFDAEYIIASQAEWLYSDYDVKFINSMKILWKQKIKSFKIFQWKVSDGF